MSGINAASSAALYGKGVFTTIAIRSGEPFLWEKHWRRLSENAERLSIDLSEHSEPGTLDSLKTAIKSRTDGRARITFFDESPTTIWPSPGPAKTRVDIIAGDRRPAADQLRLGVSPFRVNTASPLAGIKSCNYLEHVIAFEEARSRGFDEAVRLNENEHISSACMANIFWTKGDKIFTPSLTTGCLAGTTRAYILENLDCEEVEAEIDLLADADQIFLTSAGLGAACVADFDGRKLAIRDERITGLLRR